MKKVTSAIKDLNSLLKYREKKHAEFRSILESTSINSFDEYEKCLLKEIERIKEAINVYEKLQDDTRALYRPL